jgi:ABC-type iron transport system FetAB ATPase subunit
LLEVRNLQSAQTLHPVDLRLQAGECVAILGPSGSGKSVLLRLIADLDPGSGDVILGGRSRASWSAPQWRSRVTYQAAEAAWWAPRVHQHFPAEALPAAEAMLPRLGLPITIMESEILRLSTGERQRLALVRTLAANPEVALLDEPTASLDQASTVAVETLLQERLARGLAIMLVTHSREQAARLSTRSLEFVDRRVQVAAS